MLGSMETEIPMPSSSANLGVGHGHPEINAVQGGKQPRLTRKPNSSPNIAGRRAVKAFISEEAAASSDLGLNSFSMVTIPVLGAHLQV